MEHRHTDTGEELSRSQFAEMSLLSMKALRLYEERGLLVPSRTDQVSGYRYYSRAQARTGRLIAVLRRAGATLEEIGGVVIADDPAAAARALSEVNRRLREHSTASHALLAQARAELGQETVGRAAAATCLHLPEQVVLSIIDDVDVDRLIPHIEDRVRLLEEHASQRGVDVLGQPFGIFHGPVDRDSRGPLEVLLPVSRLGGSEGPVRCQRTPGGLFATVTVQGAEATFPRVLAAYAAAGSWIDQHGHARIGPPRELWLDHTNPAAPVVVAVPYVPRVTPKDRS